MYGGRIEDENRSYLTVILGLIAAVAVGGGAYYFMHIRAAEQKAAHYDGSKPVPSDTEVRRMLKEDQWHVTREGGTEPAFQNLYWNNVRPGLYIDVISGEPLFSSNDKFDFQNGRPNFTKPLQLQSLTEKPDTSFGMERTEVRTVKSSSHLGHLFHDGPAGTRYTVNSAALRFIPADKLAEEGYGDYASLFPGAATPTENK